MNLAQFSDNAASSGIVHSDTIEVKLDGYW